MLDGVGLTATQIALLAGLAVLLGAQVGWLLAARRHMGHSAARKKIQQHNVDLEEDLKKSKRRAKKAESDLADSRNELTAEQERFASFADKKDAEMGRLETGAIAALERSIGARDDEVSELKQRVASTEKSLAEADASLVEKTARLEKFATTLAERDARLAQVMNDIQQMDATISSLTQKLDS